MTLHGRPRRSSVAKLNASYLLQCVERRRGEKADQRSTLPTRRLIISRSLGAVRLQRIVMCQCFSPASLNESLAPTGTMPDLVRGFVFHLGFHHDGTRSLELHDKPTSHRENVTSSGLGAASWTCSVQTPARSAPSAHRFARAADHHRSIEATLPEGSFDVPS